MRSYASSLSGNMASAARLALAAISEASSMVRLGSCPMTDMTMLIIIWRRRILRASSSRSFGRLLSCSPQPCIPMCGPLQRGAVILIFRWHDQAGRCCPPLSSIVKRDRSPRNCREGLDLGHRGVQGGSRGLQSSGPLRRRNFMPAAEKRPQPDPNEKLVKVFDSEQETEVLVVKGLLDSAGIE